MILGCGRGRKTTNKSSIRRVGLRNGSLSTLHADFIQTQPAECSITTGTGASVMTNGLLTVVNDVFCFYNV